jgi:hypothetical protein
MGILHCIVTGGLFYLINAWKISEIQYLKQPICTSRGFLKNG